MKGEKYTVNDDILTGGTWCGVVWCGVVWCGIMSYNKSKDDVLQFL